MNRSKKTLLKVMFYRTLVVSGIFAYSLVLASTGTHKTNYVTNTNGVKSIEAYHMVDKYDNRKQELKVMQSDKDFSFEVKKRNNTENGTPVVIVRDGSGKEVATVVLWYNEVGVHNRMTGGESTYKSFNTALSGLRRQYKNRR